jgi:D-tyrosyl-tRNA(Tyr) deacylase
MIALIQRVKRAEVIVNGQSMGKIDRGILTFLGVRKGDHEELARKLVEKIADLRIFEDAEGKMNLSLREISGGHLLVSQFTLAADTSSGRRPSFTGAERPEIAKQLYEAAIAHSRQQGLDTASGVFGAMMEVSLVNDGPATFILKLGEPEEAPRPQAT